MRLEQFKHQWRSIVQSATAKANRNRAILEKSVEVRTDLSYRLAGVCESEDIEKIVMEQSKP